MPNLHNIQVQSGYASPTIEVVSAITVHLQQKWNLDPSASDPFETLQI